MFGELKTIFESLSANPDVRCVLFSGAGPRAFTSGLDVTQAASPSSPLFNTRIDPARRAFSLRQLVRFHQAAVSSLDACQKPIIILYHGVSYGLGIDIGSAADIRLCSTDTRFCVKEVGFWMLFKRHVLILLLGRHWVSGRLGHAVSLAYSPRGYDKLV